MYPTAKKVFKPLTAVLGIPCIRVDLNEQEASDAGGVNVVACQLFFFFFFFFPCCDPLLDRSRIVAVLFCD